MGMMLSERRGEIKEEDQKPVRKSKANLDRKASSRDWAKEKKEKGQGANRCQWPASTTIHERTLDLWGRRRNYTCPLGERTNQVWAKTGHQRGLS